MVQTVSFPGLGWTFELNRVAFSLFGLNVYWYGVIIAFGFLLAILYANWRAPQVGLDADAITDVVFGASIIGVIGARLYYVAFRWEDFSHDLWSILDTRNGGLAIYGGIIFGFVSGWLLARWRKVRFLPLADLAAGGFLIAQSVGRWGNFFNVEAFGSNTSLPWGMTGPSIQNYLSLHQQELEALGVAVDPMQPVHPTFLYESLWCLLGFLLLQLLMKRRRFDGQGLLFYLGWYGAGRMVIEGLRTDSLLIGSSGIRVSQLLAAALVLASLCIYLLVERKRKAQPERFVLYVDTEESRQLLAKKSASPAESNKSSDEKNDENSKREKNPPEEP